MFYIKMCQSVPIPSVSRYGNSRVVTTVSEVASERTSHRIPCFDRFLLSVDLFDLIFAQY
jgi:hypothetical protein